MYAIRSYYGACQAGQGPDQGPVVPDLVGHPVVEALGVMGFHASDPVKYPPGDENAGARGVVVVGEISYNFV